MALSNSFSNAGEDADKTSFVGVGGFGAVQLAGTRHGGHEVGRRMLPLLAHVSATYLVVLKTRLESLQR